MECGTFNESKEKKQRNLLNIRVNRVSGLFMSFSQHVASLPHVTAQNYSENVRIVKFILYQEVIFTSFKVNSTIYSIALNITTS